MARPSSVLLCGSPYTDARYDGVTWDLPFNSLELWAEDYEAERRAVAAEGERIPEAMGVARVLDHLAVGRGPAT
jgi:hypothetical protein